MAENNNKFEIPSEGIETPHGFLYHPPKQGIQILYLILAFFTAIFLGFVISSIPGDLSELGEGVIYFTFLLIFTIGYSAWISMLGAILFKNIKLPLLKILFRFLIRREKPDSLQELLPAREKIIELMVRAQKAARIFFILSFPIGIAVGFLSMFFSTSMNSLLLFIIVVISSIIYGYFLYYFARRGYMPFPEE